MSACVVASLQLVRDHKSTRKAGFMLHDETVCALKAHSQKILPIVHQAESKRVGIFDTPSQLHDDEGPACVLTQEAAFGSGCRCLCTLSR